MLLLSLVAVLALAVMLAVALRMSGLLNLRISLVATTVARVVAALKV